MWDIIGDIHGEADKLSALLHCLGYKRDRQNHFKHPTRKVCFLGDYIDRGGQIAESVAIVKAMTESGAAVALMGNHEFNYLAFMTKRVHPPGKSQRAGIPLYVRRRNNRHRNEIRATQQSFARLPHKGTAFLKWFYTLPYYYETKNFRAVHAAWEPRAIAWLAQTPHVTRKHCITDEFITHFHHNNHTRIAFQHLLKGITLDLPTGITFTDHSGERRHYVRLAWWKQWAETTQTLSLSTLKDLLIMPSREATRIAKLLMQPRHTALRQSIKTLIPSYSANSKPLFIGHYWLKQERIKQFMRRLNQGKERPYLLNANICCLDFSAAQGGPLVAYRFNGERTLTAQNFIWV